MDDHSLWLHHKTHLKKTTLIWSLTGMQACINTQIQNLHKQKKDQHSDIPTICSLDNITNTQILQGGEQESVGSDTFI